MDRNATYDRTKAKLGTTDTPGNEKWQQKPIRGSLQIQEDGFYPQHCECRKIHTPEDACKTVGAGGRFAKSSSNSFSKSSGESLPTPAEILTFCGCCKGRFVSH